MTFAGPGGPDNAVSRVAGGEASRVDGTLASEVGRAAVWLVNPSGTVFGRGARLDVPGSFRASTAAEVRFPDGAAFSALDPGGSTLSVAPPEAFGFLGAAKPSAITGVLGGGTPSLVGGDVTATAAEGSDPSGVVSLRELWRHRADVFSLSAWEVAAPHRSQLGE